MTKGKRRSSGRCVVETLAEHLEADVEVDTLDVSKRFAQGVSSIVAVELNLATPRFQHL